MTPRSQRQEQKDLTRKSLIEAATLLFAQNGFTKTTTADVTKALKLSHGTVFVHFPKREDLIHAVIDDFGSRLASELKKNVGAESELEKVLKAHIRSLTAYEDFYFRLLSELHSLPNSIKSTVFMLNSAVSWNMWEATEPLIKSGKIRKIDRPSLFNTWMALIHYHLVNREQFSTQKSIFKDKGDALVKHFMNLIQNQKEKKQ